jgi:hypothetical protein
LECDRENEARQISGGLRYPQAVEGEQGDQRVLDGRAEPGGDEEGAEFVAVQGGGTRLVVQLLRRRPLSPGASGAASLRYGRTGLGLR